MAFKSTPRKLVTRAIRKTMTPRHGFSNHSLPGSGIDTFCAANEGDTITFYDIPSKMPFTAWSPNTWKTRYCLNYKSLSYRTEWVEYPDIEQVSRTIGISPTSKRADGSLYYSLPAISDSRTGLSISESSIIADYLDQTYPNTPKMFPSGTKALQYAFLDAFRTSVQPGFKFTIPVVASKLNPKSMEYFIRTRTKIFGKDPRQLLLTGLSRDEEWNRVQKGFATVNGWLDQNAGNGPFVMGEYLTFSDCVIGAYLFYMRAVWGEDSQEWKDVCTWNNGRWQASCDALKKYEKVVCKWALFAIVG